MSKKIIVSGILVIICCLLISCAGGLEVVSDIDGLQKMREDDLPAFDFDVNKYYYELEPDKDIYFVSEVNGKLFVSYERPKSEKSHVFSGDNSYFLGVNLGEFDGWVKEYPYYSTFPDVTREPKLVIDECCYGFADIDNRNAYVFVGLTHMSRHYTKIFKLECDFDPNDTDNETSDWACTELADIEESYFGHAYEDGRAYLLTQKNLYVIEDGNVTALFEDSELEFVTSIAVIDGIIYIGSLEGIYAYDIESDALTWYRK